MARDSEKRRLQKAEAMRLQKAEAMRRLRRDGKPRALTAVLTPKEVADILTARGEKISRARVEQIEHRALAKLRHALADLACDFAPESEA